MSIRAQWSPWEQVTEGAGLALLLLAPLYINPTASGAFESAKTRLLWLAVTIMAGSYLGGRLAAVVHRSARTIQAPAPDSGPLSDARPHAPRLLLAAVCIYLSAQMAATLTSVDVRRSLLGAPEDPGGFVTLLCLAVLAILFGATLLREQQVHRAVSVLLAASLSVVVYGFVQALGLDPISWVTDSVSPVQSTIGRSIYLGAYLAMLIPFTLWRLSSVAYSRWRYGLLLALQAGCLALTLARGAWLGAVAGAAVFFALLACRHRTARAWGMVAIVVLVGIALFLPMNSIAWPGYGEGQKVASTRPRGAAEAGELQNWEAQSLRTTSVERRIIIWRAAAQLAADRPFLGYGPAVFDEVFNKRYLPGSLYAGRDTFVTDPHNLILDQLTSAGIAGLLAFAMMILSFVWMMVRTTMSSPAPAVQVGLAACAGALVAYLVQALVTPDVVIVRLLFWTVLALAMALERSSSRAWLRGLDP